MKHSRPPPNCFAAARHNPTASVRQCTLQTTHLHLIPQARPRHQIKILESLKDYGLSARNKSQTMSNSVSSPPAYPSKSYVGPRVCGVLPRVHGIQYEKNYLGPTNHPGAFRLGFSFRLFFQSRPPTLPPAVKRDGRSRAELIIQFPFPDRAGCSPSLLKHSP